MGTAQPEVYTWSPQFSRASESSPDAPELRHFPRHGPFLGGTHSRAPCPSQRKEKPPRGSLGFSRMGCVTRTHLCHSGFGNLSLTPFPSAQDNAGHHLSLGTGARLSLSSD
ncbi:hypothetical protein VULLAG_LOCUS20737 [Vulpes lagopus]